MNNGEGHPDHHPEKNHKNHQKEAGEKTQQQKEGEQMSRHIETRRKENNVDIDRLYQATAPMFADGQKVTVTIPMIGDLRLDREDIEKLYRYMREGQ